MTMPHELPGLVWARQEEQGGLRAVCDTRDIVPQSKTWPCGCALVASGNHLGGTQGPQGVPAGRKGTDSKGRAAQHLYETPGFWGKCSHVHQPGVAAGLIFESGKAISPRALRGEVSVPLQYTWEM